MEERREKFSLEYITFEMSKFMFVNVSLALGSKVGRERWAWDHWLHRKQ